MFYEKETIHSGALELGTVQRIRKSFDGNKWLARSNLGGVACTRTKAKAICFLHRADKSERCAVAAYDLRRFTSEELVAELTARTNEGALSEDQSSLDL